MKKLSFLILLACGLLLTACSKHENQTDDLVAYVNQLKQTLGKQSEKPVELVIIKSATYQAGGLRSPFLTGAEEQKSTQADKNARSALEFFPLDVLQFIGIVAQENNQLLAVIATPDHKVYQVGTGSLIGDNNGRVTNITANEVQITQQVPDETGHLSPHRVTLQLKGN